MSSLSFFLNFENGFWPGFIDFLLLWQHGVKDWVQMPGFQLTSRPWGLPEQECWYWGLKSLFKTLRLPCLPATFRFERSHESFPLRISSNLEKVYEIKIFSCTYHKIEGEASPPPNHINWTKLKWQIYFYLPEI